MKSFIIALLLFSVAFNSYANPEISTICKGKNTSCNDVLTKWRAFLYFQQQEHTWKYLTKCVTDSSGSDANVIIDSCLETPELEVARKLDTEINLKRYFKICNDVKKCVEGIIGLKENFIEELGVANGAIAGFFFLECIEKDDLSEDNVKFCIQYALHKSK